MESVQESVNEVFFVFEDILKQNNSKIFRNPVEEVKAFSLDKVEKAFQRIDQLRREGFYLAGYVSYEAGFAFLPKSISFKKTNMPLLHFFAFRNYEEERMLASDETAVVYNFRNQDDYENYKKKIHSIHQHQKIGETYQANYTFKKYLHLQGSSESLYQKLKKYQRVEYAAFLKFPYADILSFSPELFLKKEGTRLVTKPMKGTAKRLRQRREDDQQKETLRNDEKTIAENVMVVDLLRNDMARIAQPATVKTTSLFDIETYETVHQMVSAVECQVNAEESIGSIFKALFPCGSITGAPKLKTMEILAELEEGGRGVYTGAIGFIQPNNDFCFNVAIRTLVVSPDKSVSLGVGGGILYDSVAESEYEECETKSSFVNRINSDFALIETFAARKDGAPTLELHLERLKKSAQIFGFQFDREKIKKEILEEQRDLSGGDHKLRLLLFQDGDLEITSQSILTPSEKCRVGISRRAIDSRDIFYKHKTTARELYDDEYEAAQKKGLYDVIFLNEMGYVAEASRHNIFIKKNGQFWTPPLSSGALPGIRRALQIREWQAEEKNLSLNDLRDAQEIYLTNSVRGVIKVSHLESL